MALHGFVEHFEREAQLVARLDHPNIVRVLDTERAYGTVFIVMERLAGALLEDVITEQRALPWGAVRRIVKEIASALQYSHSLGLIHRDIKPTNVFLTQESTAKVLDFGVAVQRSP